MGLFWVSPVIGAAQVQACEQFKDGLRRKHPLTPHTQGLDH